MGFHSCTIPFLYQYIREIRFLQGRVPGNMISVSVLALRCEQTPPTILSARPWIPISTFTYTFNHFISPPSSLQLPLSNPSVPSLQITHLQLMLTFASFALLPTSTACQCVHVFFSHSNLRIIPNKHISTTYNLASSTCSPPSPQPTKPSRSLPVPYLKSAFFKFAWLPTCAECQC